MGEISRHRYGISFQVAFPSYRPFAHLPEGNHQAVAVGEALRQFVGSQGKVLPHGERDVGREMTINIVRLLVDVVEPPEGVQVQAVAMESSNIRFDLRASAGLLVVEF